MVVCGAFGLPRSLVAPLCRDDRLEVLWQKSGADSDLHNHKPAKSL